MKNALYVQQYGKKPIALAIVKLCLSEGIRQLVSQWKLLFNDFFLKKIRNNFLEVFQVYL